MSSTHPLKALRIKLKLTIVDVAVLTGISATCISRIERGDKFFKVRWETAYTLARGLGVPLEELFDPDELSDDGRPPLTGGYTLKKAPKPGTICPTCQLEIAKQFHGICPTCT